MALIQEIVEDTCKSIVRSAKLAAHVGDTLVRALSDLLNLQHMLETLVRALSDPLTLQHSLFKGCLLVEIL